METQLTEGRPETGIGENPSPLAAEPVETIQSFWEPGPGFDEVVVCVKPPDPPLELLRKLGASPFDRTEFPLIGFLATTYEKVSRYALERKSGVA